MRLSLCTLAFALLATGCAGERDALRKELADLQQEMGRLRAQNNLLAARVETLELAREKAAPRAPAKPSAEDDGPSLDVVHLAPEAAGAQATDVGGEGALGVEEEREEPRPVLRSVGRGEVVTQVPAAKASPKGAARPAGGTSR